MKRKRDGSLFWSNFIVSSYVIKNFLNVFLLTLLGTGNFILFLSIDSKMKIKKFNKY